VGGFGYPYPYFQANCGDIDLIGQRKPQNHWRAAVDGASLVEMLVERPAPAGTEQVAVWWGYYDELESWTWGVESGHPMTVHVYTQGDSVTLLLNGDTVATRAVTATDWATATLTVPYAPGELTAVASRGGTEIGRKTIATVGAPAALRLTPDVAVLTTSRDALAHVLVKVTDARGRLVPDAVTEVTFQVSGAGELVGVANGNPHNVDSFRRPSRYTWHSRALAILRPAKHPGAVRLTAQAPGLRPAALTLPVRGGGLAKGGWLAACHRANDQVGLRAGRYRLGQRDVGRLVRQVQLAGEEPDERPARPALVTADRPAQHRVAGLQRVQDRPLGNRAFDIQSDLAVDPRQRAQVRWEYHPDHGSVWTSTDSTAGRSRTIGSQVSPESGEA
jgi:hypothetical protein